MNYALLKENRALNWMEFPATAPDWVKRHCIEHRAAQLEKRAVDPRYLAQYANDAERRYRAAVAAGRLKPIRRNGLTLDEVRAIAKRTGTSFEEVLFGKSPRNVDAWYRQRLADIGAVILKDAAKRSSEDEDPLDDDPDDFSWDDEDAPKKHKRKAAAHRHLAHKATDCFAASPHFRAADLHDAAADNNRSFSAHAAAQAASRALRKK
jgi:hypothetical protein